MSMPQEVTGVPRHLVDDFVRSMLRNDEVGDVLCRETERDRYTITPLPRAGRGDDEGGCVDPTDR